MNTLTAWVIERCRRNFRRIIRMVLWLLSLGYLSPMIISKYSCGVFFPFYIPALYNYIYIILGIILFGFEYINMGVKFIDDNDITYYAKFLTFFPMKKIIKKELRNALKLQKISVNSMYDNIAREVILRLLEKHFESKYKKYENNYNKKIDCSNLGQRVIEVRDSLRKGEFVVDDLPRPVQYEIESY